MFVQGANTPVIPTIKILLKKDMENQNKHIQNYEDIDLDNLSEGQSITCKMRGAQGVDGSKYDLIANLDGSTTIIKKTL